jgi:dTDP-4-amino-4,6-dideoxy-D-galactose acyltransferase
MNAASSASFRVLDWDSAHFGLRIGRVLPMSADAELFKQALTWADQSSLDCMYLLVESDDAATVRRASEFGWRMVDIRVTLGTKLSDQVTSQAPMRQANVADLSYLKQLATRSHTHSRFYTDGNFRVAACDELFSSWIERSVRDRDFAGAVFMPEVGDEPGGYITCAIKQGVGYIGLVAVDPVTHGKGLGTSLLAEAARWFSEQGTERVAVVTQGCNIPALRMYQRFGFTIESIQLWFHWWGFTGGANPVHSRQATRKS